jgi:hypothetical protein
MKLISITNRKMAIEILASGLVKYGNLALDGTRGIEWISCDYEGNFRVEGIKFLGKDDLIYLEGINAKGRYTDRFDHILNFAFKSIKSYRNNNNFMIAVGDDHTAVMYFGPGPYKLELNDDGKWEITSPGRLTNSRGSKYFRSGWKSVGGVIGHICGDRTLYYSPIIQGAARCTKCRSQLNKERLKFLLLEEGMGS